MKITIKPHHLLDLICDMGANNGVFEYISPYGHNMRAIGNLLAQGQIDSVSFTSGADDACRPCLKLNNGICSDTYSGELKEKFGYDKKYDYNMMLDTRFMKILPDIFTPDRELSIDDVFLMLKEQLTDEIILLNWQKNNRVNFTYKGLEMAINARKNR